MSLLHRLDPLNVAVRAEKVMFRSARALGLEGALFPAHADFIRFRDGNSRISKSQIGQDLFVLWKLGMKRGGYFVEVGAASGDELSNTCALERQFGWDGICAEPGRRWHPRLRQGRRCRIDERCVWSTSGLQLDFMECDVGELSTVASLATSDDLERGQLEAQSYRVDSVSLTDLLVQHGAPSVIDYLSIDTEGSELEILASHDFGRFTFRVITVEHNRVAGRRSAIARLLRSKGYRREMPSLSRFDDWYVLTQAPAD